MRVCYNGRYYYANDNNDQDKLINACNFLKSNHGVLFKTQGLMDCAHNAIYMKGSSQPDYRVYDVKNENRGFTSLDETLYDIYEKLGLERPDFTSTPEEDTAITDSIKGSSLTGCQKLTWGYAKFKKLVDDNKPLAYGAAVAALPIIIYCGAQRYSLKM